MKELLNLFCAERHAFSMCRLLLSAAIAVVLVLVFAAYLRPDFALDLANRFILCF